MGLTDYWTHVASVFGINVLILEANDQIFMGGQLLRTRFGLLTTDSVIVSVMEAYGLDQIASNDGDFDRVSSFKRYCPADI
jgi:predicted nucleic acid-binding protein